MRILSLRMYISSLKIHILNLKMKFLPGKLELSMQAAGSFSEKKSGKLAALLSISAIFARTES